MSGSHLNCVDYKVSVMGAISTPFQSPYRKPCQGKRGHCRPYSSNKLLPSIISLNESLYPPLPDRYSRPDGTLGGSTADVSLLNRDPEVDWFHCRTPRLRMAGYASGGNGRACRLLIMAGPFSRREGPIGVNCVVCETVTFPGRRSRRRRRGTRRRKRGISQ